jgi:hypothetical protein
MAQVAKLSALLVIGLLLSQLLPHEKGSLLYSLHGPLHAAMLILLNYIMFGVGEEFELDKNRLASYKIDVVAGVAQAALPWLFAAAYFAVFLAPKSILSEPVFWIELLIICRFASPTSAGVLFSMLEAAGLARTWVYGKARLLAVIDDVATILLMVPLSMAKIGLRPELIIVVLGMAFVGWMAWTFLHKLPLKVSWPWRFVYGVLIFLVTEGIAQASTALGATVPAHIEGLLVAFALGAMAKRPAGVDIHADDAVEGHHSGDITPWDRRIGTLVSYVFIFLVGLTTPAIFGETNGDGVTGLVSTIPMPPLGEMLLHVVALTVIINIGKMATIFFFGNEADFWARLALSIGMFPRGEVGAGVLVGSAIYGITGPVVSISTLTLAANLCLTIGFILLVRFFIARSITERKNQPVKRVARR